MKSLVFALALLSAAATAARAQGTIPDLKGTWTLRCLRSNHETSGHRFVLWHEEANQDETIH